MPEPTIPEPTIPEPTMPEPTDIAAPPRVLVAELRVAIGGPTAALYCADLVDGADPFEHADRLLFLGGRPAAAFVSGDDRWESWPPVWGARGLRYVWAETAAPAVVRGVGAEVWRVAEMCVKVAGLREIAAAADPAVPLLGNALPRVREATVRLLGLVGDTEHVPFVVDRLDDEEEVVRRSAWRACDRMERRLDVVIER